jgi:cystathionine beta-lyase
VIKMALRPMSKSRLRARNGEKWRSFDPDVIPATVAEMDFEVAEPVKAAIWDAAVRSDCGYPLDPMNWGLPEMVSSRMERFSWSVAPERVSFLSDVMQGVYIAIQQLTSMNDGILVMVPTYPPLLEAPRILGRRLLTSCMKPNCDGSAVDVEDIEAKVRLGARMLMICNPNNPSGHVLSRSDLTKLADVASRYDLIVLSDEIYQDLVYRDGKHIPIASVSADAQRRTITLTSATKAFNVAGIGCAVAIFGDDGLQAQFERYPKRLRGRVTTISLAILKAAWTDGDEWLKDVLLYLESNRNELLRFLQKELPMVRCSSPKGAFFAWLDLAPLHLGPSPAAHLLTLAKVAVCEGGPFGVGTEEFIRLNFATSKPLLMNLLHRIVNCLRGEIKVGLE